MKIAVVFDNMIYGGIERVGISHIKLMKKLGHDVDVFVLNDKTEAIVDELKELCNVKIVNFSRWLCPNAYWGLTRRYSWGKYAFPFVFLALKFVIKFLCLFKKQIGEYDIAIAFSGHYNDLTFVSEEFINSKKKIAWLHGALYQYIITAQGFEELYKKIKNLVVLVDDAQEEVFAYHQKDGFNFRIKKIYNPVSFEDKKIDYDKVEELKKTYGKFLLMVSRMLYPHKDHYTVIKSLKALKEQYNVELNLLLVGDGPERDNLVKFCKDIGIDSQVFFLGSKSDVQNYYTASNIVVHASVAGEGLPTVLLEAMALGKPVVCTDSKVGPREIIGNNEYGLLSKVQDPDDMAKQIYLLISRPNLYELYSKKGLERIDLFSNEAILAKLKELLVL